MSKKMIMKKALAVLTALAMMFTSFGFVPNVTEEAHAASPRKDINIGADVLEGNVNTIGAQLVDMGNKRWIVVGYDGQGVSAGSDEICLLSNDNIKITAFHKEYDEAYRTSDLKKEIDTFTDEQFSAGEKAAIVPRTLSATVVDDIKDEKWWLNNYQTVDEVIDDNPIEGVLLWPLSAKEACAVDPEIRKTGNDYWLRSLGRPGYYYYYWVSEWDDEFEEEYMPPAMAIVKADGSVAIQSENASYWKGMRPAFKLRKSDIVLTSYDKRSSEDGKLTQVQLNSTTKLWKVTLSDTEHKNFKIDPCDVTFGEDVTIEYSGAKTGDNEFISAIIKGGDGGVKYYGRIAKATEEAGTVTIKDMPALDDGDKLYIFNEQYHSEMYGQKTDFSSNLKEVSRTGHDWVFDDLRYDEQEGKAKAAYRCSRDSSHTTEIDASSAIEQTDPTCEEPGKEYRVLTISAEDSLDGKQHRKSIYLKDYTDALGHVYNHYFGFRWTGDASSGYTKAEAIFACDRDYSHKTYIEGVVTEKVQEPTCEGIGRTLYQATIDADKSLDGKDHGEAKYAKAKPRLGHDWGEATYTWADDNSSVTATHVCKRDPSHVGTETVKTEITNITKAPTCKDTGIGDFTTKDFWDSAFQVQTKTGATIPIDPEAHDWKETGRQDNPNECGGYVTEFKCELCGEEKTEVIGGNAHDWTDYIVDYEPTCTGPGEKSRHCRNCEAHDLDGIETIDPIGHKWKFVDFTWTGDETDGYTKAVANYVCENDPSHTTTANAEINEEVIEPTCQSGGKTVYTASLSAADSPDEAEHSESKDAEATEAVPHEWEFSGMKWTGNETDGYTKAVAEYTCRFGCEETEQVEAKIAEKTTAPDCENGGKIIYEATVKAEDSLTGEEHTDSKEVKISDALGHSWHLKDMLWTGDEKSGFTKAEAKYVCENDESHEQLVDAKITEEVIEPTCIEEGYTVYKAEVGSADSPTGAECMDVNFAKFKEPKGHAWELKGFTWEATDDKRGFRAEANYVCKHDADHAESVGADIRIEEKDATCEEPGGTLYTAIVNKEKSLTDAEVKDEKFIKTADPAGHKWGEWKVTKEATTTSEGEETRTCSVCDKKETRSIKKLDPDDPAPEPKVSPGGTLIAKAVASGKTALRFKWTKVKNVDGYDIFLSRCNFKDKKYTPKKIKTVKGNKTFKFTKKKLAKNTSYKAYVKAYVKVNGKKKYVRKSPVMHVYSGGYRGKYTNPKSVTVTKKAISLKKGKTFKIKAKVSKLKKAKSLSSGHTAKLRYLTSNKKIAAVSKTGKVKAKAKGSCTIYVYAANGVWKTMKVTVK